MLPTKFFPDAPKRPDLLGAPQLFQLFRLALEVELQRELHQARIARPFHAAEVAAIGCVAIRLVELRMVEQIENLSAKLDSVPLADISVLQNSDISLQRARSP